MWFGYRGEESNWIPVTVDRVQEILGLNAKGERPQTIDGAESAKIELELEKGSGPLNADLDKMDRKYGGGKKKFDKIKVDRPDFKQERKEFVRPERKDLKPNPNNQRPERKDFKQDPRTDINNSQISNVSVNKVQGDSPQGQRVNQKPPIGGTSQGQKGNKLNPIQQRPQGQALNGEGQSPKPKQNQPRPQGNVEGQQSKQQNQPRPQGQPKLQNQPRPQGNGQANTQNQPRPQGEGEKQEGQAKPPQRSQNQQGGVNKNNPKPNNNPPSESKGDGQA